MAGVGCVCQRDTGTGGLPSTRTVQAPDSQPSQPGFVPVARVCRAPALPCPSSVESRPGFLTVTSTLTPAPGGRGPGRLDLASAGIPMKFFFNQ